MRIVQMLHKLFHIGSDTQFIEQMFWELLHRQPDPEEIRNHTAGLRHGKISRVKLFETVVLSEEAAGGVSRFQQSNLIYEAPTIGSLLHGLLCQDNAPFVKGLYRELLCREPDQESLACHLSALASGHSRLDLFCQFIASEECARLLALPRARPLAHKILLHILGEHRKEHQTGNAH